MGTADTQVWKQRQLTLGKYITQAAGATGRFNVQYTGRSVICSYLLAIVIIMLQ